MLIKHASHPFPFKFSLQKNDDFPKIYFKKGAKDKHEPYQTNIPCVFPCGAWKGLYTLKIQFDGNFQPFHGLKTIEKHMNIYYTADYNENSPKKNEPHPTPKEKSFSLEDEKSSVVINIEMKSECLSARNKDRDEPFHFCVKFVHPSIPQNSFTWVSTPFYTVCKFTKKHLTNPKFQTAIENKYNLFYKGCKKTADSMTRMVENRTLIEFYKRESEISSNSSRLINIMSFLGTNTNQRLRKPIKSKKARRVVEEEEEEENNDQQETMEVIDISETSSQPKIRIQPNKKQKTRYNSSPFNSKQANTLESAPPTIDDLLLDIGQIPVVNKNNTDFSVYNPNSIVGKLLIFTENFSNTMKFIKVCSCSLEDNGTMTVEGIEFTKSLTMPNSFNCLLDIEDLTGGFCLRKIQRVLNGTEQWCNFYYCNRNEQIAQAIGHSLSYFYNYELSSPMICLPVHTLHREQIGEIVFGCLDPMNWENENSNRLFWKMRNNISACNTLVQEKLFASAKNITGNQGYPKDLGHFLRLVK